MPPSETHEVRRPSIVALTLSALAGVFVFDRCLGFAVLDPGDIDWIFHWGIDPSVNFMGWHMFRSEAWGLPPGILRSYGHPVGSSIGITDSLPVIAMPLKLVADQLPPIFQFLGLWYLACYVLLAVFGCLLVASVTASPWVQVLGGSIIGLSPALVHRMGHASLSGHWLIVAALWLHVTCRTHGVSRGRFVAWMALLWVAAGVTPYIAAMVVALALPTIAGRITEGAARLLMTGFAFLAITIAGWWAGGYFILGAEDVRNPGFDVLSTNLLAPFDAPAGSLLEHVLPITVRSADQLDGYCYLGLGVFWLTGVSLMAARPRFSRNWSITDAAFALVMTGMGLYALSSTITFGTRVVFQYDPAWWGPLTTLRASGRFIWPVYYALVFALVALVARRLPRRTAIVVLGIAVVLQMADLWGPMSRVRTAHPSAGSRPLASPFWGRVLPRYAHLVLSPTNMCSPQGGGFDYRYFALEAGQARVTINAGYAARHDAAALASYCAALADDIAERRVRDDTMYVVADHLVPHLRASDPPVTCVRVDGFAVCVTSATLTRWDPAIDLRHHPLPPDGEVQEFRAMLESEYRDRLRRPAQTYAGTIALRATALAHYFDLRINGCSDQEAVERLSDPSAVLAPSIPCHGHALDPLPIPPGDAGVAARARLLEEWTRRGVPATETFVDGIGEATWLQAYLDLRLQRRSPDEATAEVVAGIRRAQKGLPHF
jgi:hypothetical protein